MKNPFDASAIASRTPAKLDVAQSVTGLALALFMWTHLLLVSSILLGNDAMYYVTKTMEGAFLRDGHHGYPIIVTLIGILIFTIFIAHAGIALRKFPASWKQHKIIRNQMKILKHKDTNHWFIQYTTGFVMFFLGSVHLYIMITNPDNIGPYASSDRFVTGWLWPLYFVLLFAVEMHATIGMYRLAVKWGFFDGKNPRVTRKRLKLAKNILTTFFIVIGLLSFAAYMKIGLAHRDNAGERYKPAHSSISMTRGNIG